MGGARPWRFPAAELVHPGRTVSACETPYAALKRPVFFGTVALPHVQAAIGASRVMGEIHGGFVHWKQAHSEIQGCAARISEPQAIRGVVRRLRPDPGLRD